MPKAGVGTPQEAIPARSCRETSSSLELQTLGASLYIHGALLPLPCPCAPPARAGVSFQQQPLFCRAGNNGTLWAAAGLAGLALQDVPSASRVFGPSGQLVTKSAQNPVFLRAGKADFWSARGWLKQSWAARRGKQSGCVSSSAAPEVTFGLILQK